MGALRWKRTVPGCLGDCLQDNCEGSHKLEEFTGVDGWLRGKKEGKGGKRKRLNLILKSEVQMNTGAMEHHHPPPPSPHSPLSRRKSEGDGAFTIIIWFLITEKCLLPCDPPCHPPSGPVGSLTYSVQASVTTTRNKGPLLFLQQTYFLSFPTYLFYLPEL